MKGDDRDDNDKSKMTQRRPTQVPSDGKDMNNFSSSLDEASAAAGEIHAATKGATEVSSGWLRGDAKNYTINDVMHAIPPFCAPGLESQTKGND